MFLTIDNNLQFIFYSDKFKVSYECLFELKQNLREK